MSFRLSFKKPSPKVEIHLQGQGSGPYRSYTTGDCVEGYVSVFANRNMPLGRVGVIFQGKSQVKIEQALLYRRTKCELLFLKLNLPSTGTPHLLRSNEEYRFPFSFVIPDELPLQFCQHHTSNIHAFMAHLQLPPTLGWTETEHKPRSVHDLATDVAQISYAIQALLFSHRTQDAEELLSTTTLPVRVIPAVEEAPPRATLGCQFYRTEKEKVLRHGFVGRTRGRLHVSMQQPRPVKATQLGLSEEQNASTAATVELSFTPVGEQGPPALHSITVTLCAVTLYSATPWETFPDLLIGDSSFGHGGRGIYWNTITSSNFSIKSVPWTQSLKPPVNGLDLELDSKGSKPCSMTPFTASIVVPVTVPAKYQLVPTFHSCLVSRVYLLDVDFCYYRSSGTAFASEVSLRVPVQVVN
ncbi:arrestin (or S-antigen) N-terminal domain protein [Penicillium capsulatum]|uniref:Arrestin (Or S-antigen) N-terminal domain protein n=1 Tax=Penicillium capsulatum TaxID=69766 RepID=A0A9W9I155_9EURO|nr:arrestin (or S-antigen) N-terminal domain protein [Penicillium capsulatum]KAJ6117196.1 arrestin (or S-antigen) N-terminal domain protein [Penicillium capsulatum]